MKQDKLVEGISDLLVEISENIPEYYPYNAYQYYAEKLAEYIRGKIPEKKERTKENLTLKIVEFENADKASGWFDGYNAFRQKLLENLGGER